jgi:hypothetical protein
VYLKGASDKPFETFTYHGKSFDVRNVIEAIGKQSALMWKESKSEEGESKREEEKNTYMKSITAFPLCLEILIVYYDKVVTQLRGESVEFDWRERKQIYTGNRDCVELMNYIAHQINFLCGDLRFKPSDYVENTCPEDCRSMIQSPNSETNWSRAVWCIYLDVKTKGFTGTFNKDVLEQMEHWLSQRSAKTSTDVAETDARLGRVATWLEKIDEERVSLRVWMDKLDAFCERWEGRKFPIEFYENVVDMIFEVRTEVKRNPLDKAWIKRLIYHITTAVDDNGHLFKASVGAKYVFNGKPANIMDTLEHLPDELQDVAAPSSASFPRSRSPVMGFSPFGPASPYAPPEQGRDKRVKTGGLAAGDIERIQKWPHCCRVLENFMETIVEPKWKDMEELEHVQKWRDQVYYSKDPQNNIKEEPRNPIDAFEYWASVLMWNVYPETMKNLQNVITYTPNNLSVPSPPGSIMPDWTFAVYVLRWMVIHDPMVSESVRDVYETVPLSVGLIDDIERLYSDTAHDANALELLPDELQEVAASEKQVKISTLLHALQALM